MSNSRRKFQICLSAFLAVCFSVSCTNSRKSDASNYDLIMGNDYIPKVIKNIIKAVYDNDSHAFAKEISYPLRRPYPLKDINDEKEMETYYATLVDDSLRNVILNSTPDDWEKYGWRGYGLKDGSYLWIDETLYDINYVSAREKSLIDSLTMIEKNSLPRRLGEGWEPILTLLSANDGKIYRIDIKTSAGTQPGSLYRLSVYNSPDNTDALLKMPDEMMDGYMKSEGTAAVVSYIFPDRNGGEYVIYPDDPSTGNPILVSPEGRESDLTKSYWHELIKD